MRFFRRLLQVPAFWDLLDGMVSISVITAIDYNC